MVFGSWKSPPVQSVRVARINEKCDEGSKQSSAVNAQGYLGASNVTRDRRA